MKVKMHMRRRSLIVFLLTAVLLLTAIPASGYLEGTYGLKGAANLGINLFFDNLSTEKPAGGGQSALEKYQATIPNLTAEEKIWGHIGNPYVISHSAHLQNLSKLQNSGFFAEQFPKTKPGAAGPFTRDDMPYFLVCDKNKNPVVVSGAVIYPVGNDKYPFVGSIKGASGSAQYLTRDQNGQNISTTTSAIHSVTVTAVPDQIDVGFFGKIGCLGTRPAAGESAAFAGIPSELSNLVFSDIQISATANSVPQNPTDHVYYADLIPPTQQKTGEILPNETHHLGIIAGHVEYAKADRLSIYYSKPSIQAFTLSGQNNNQNYFCSTGYFGLVDNLNPEYNGNGQIVAGTGVDNSEISYGYNGGGGILSGTHKGYLRAEEVFYKYGGQDGQPLVLLKATNGKEKLAQYISRGIFTKLEGYYFYDNVFTFALSSKQNENMPEMADTLRDIWPSGATQSYNQFKLNGFENMTMVRPPELKVQYYVSFQKNPESTQLTVWSELDGEKKLQIADDDGVYRLVEGIYYYTAQNDGYITQENIEFSVSGENEHMVIPVTLEEDPARETTGDQEQPEAGTTEPTEDVPNSTEKLPESTGTPEEDTGAQTEPSVVPTESIPEEPSTEPTESIPGEPSTEPAESVPEEPSATPTEDKNMSTDSAQATTTPEEYPYNPTEESAAIESAAKVPYGTEALAETIPSRASADTPVCSIYVCMAADIQPEADTAAKMIPVYFICDPENSKLTVWDSDGNVLVQEAQTEQPISDNEHFYRLLPGQYFYSAELDEFEPIERSELLVDETMQSLEVPVKMNPISIPELTVPMTELPELTEPEGSEPSTPTEPSAPAEPGTPTEPSVPAEPGAPTEPSVPAEPSAPTEPSVPAEPSTPTEPSVPAESSGAPTEPAESIPVESSTPTEPEESLQDQTAAPSMMTMQVPSFTAEQVTVPVGVPSIHISNNWNVAQQGQSTARFRIVEQVTSPDRLRELVNKMNDSSTSIPAEEKPKGFFIVGSYTDKNQAPVLNHMDLLLENKDAVPTARLQGKIATFTDPQEPQKGDQTCLYYMTQGEYDLDNQHLLQLTHKGNPTDDKYLVQNIQSGMRLGNRTRVRWNFSSYEPVRATVVSSKHSETPIGSPVTESLRRYYYTFNTMISKNPTDSTGASWLLKNVYYYKDFKIEKKNDGNTQYVVDLTNGTPCPFLIYAVYEEKKIDQSPYYFVPEIPQDLPEFPANLHVLWPENLYTTGNTDQQHDGPNDNTYALRSLEELNWRNPEGIPVGAVKDGNTHTFVGVSKMFDIIQSVDWSLQLNIGPGGAGLGSGGAILQVPVGTKGYETEIGVPTGTLAFKINKKFPADHPADIRVIVKVPTEEQPSNLSEQERKDYYLGLWAGKEAGGFFNLYSFSKNDALQFVEMPMSQRIFDTKLDPQNPTSRPSEPTQEEITNGLTRALTIHYPYNAADPASAPSYTTYLQGETVLLAYEFHVTEPGVYILATSDSAMQIVYCASDGIASAGRDGSGGSKLGSIDYVYDHAGMVVPVTKLRKNDANAPQLPQGQEDPAYYYESNLLFHFNNLQSGVPRTNNITAQIYRSLLSTQPSESPISQFDLARGGTDAGNMLADAFGSPHDRILVDGALQ